MKNEDLKSILKILIVVVLVLVAIKFFIALLPLILIVLLGYFIYDFFKKTRNKTVEKINGNSETKTTKKKHHVQEAEIVREKNED